MPCSWQGSADKAPRGARQCKIWPGAGQTGEIHEHRRLVVRPDSRRADEGKRRSYTAEAEVFLQGRPLNVTDIAVGPDGWLYFSTGGRGTEGGIYRIVWMGDVPPLGPAQGVAEALRQPATLQLLGPQSRGQNSPGDGQQLECTSRRRRAKPPTRRGRADPGART